MKQSLSFRPRSRILATLLLAWMTVFAMAEAVHTHGPLVPVTKQLSVAPSAAGPSRPDICLACLASHSPVPAAGAQIIVPVPQDAKAILHSEAERSLHSAQFVSLPSRAPPARSTTQA